MAIIAVASAKGGTGKTTAALSLAAALAQIVAKDVSTVLIDLDPCGDASQRMGVDRESALLGALLGGRRTPFEHVGDFTVLKAAHHTDEGFAVVPSCDDIEAIESHFSEMPGGAELLVYRLHALGRECCLVIDTAPGIKTLLGRAAIAAADVLVVPVVPEPGAHRHVTDIVGILRGSGGSARVFVVAAQADGTGTDIALLNDGLRSDALSVSESFPHESDVAKAVWSTGTPILLVPDSKCAKSYRNLASHIIKAIEQKRQIT